MNRTDLARYTELIGRRWRLLIIVIALALNASLLQSFLAEETFQATARIVIVERPAGDLLLNRPARDLDRALQTELRSLEGSELRRVANELLRLEPGVDFETEDPDLLLVTARYSSAQGAAVIANTYASSFVALRQNEEIARLELARGQVESQLATLQIEIDNLEAQLAIDPADLRASVRLDARLAQQNDLLSQIDDIDFLIASDPAGVELGEAATEPADPISPTPIRSAIFALVLGSVLAVVIALVADSLDDTIRTTADLESASAGVPILGAIPPCSMKEHRVASLLEPESETAEAFRTLRASVLHSLGRKPNLLIQVTSPGDGEGKTNVVANLAVSFATIGLKTAVIDADLRNPDLGSRFEELEGPGLVELLTGERALDTPLKRIGRSSTLRGLPAGSVTVNPAEVLSIDRTRSVFAHLKESFDVTIVDTPAVLSYADATVVSGLADATIVVLRAGATSRKHLGQAFTNLGLVDARVLGSVLIDAPDGLHQSDASSPGFVPFDERMLALGVGPPQLPPAPIGRSRNERADQSVGAALRDDSVAEQNSVPIPMPAAPPEEVDELESDENEALRKEGDAEGNGGRDTDNDGAQKQSMKVAERAASERSARSRAKQSTPRPVNKRMSAPVTSASAGEDNEPSHVIDQPRPVSASTKGESTSYEDRRRRGKPGTRPRLSKPAHDSVDETTSTDNPVSKANTKPKPRE